MSEDDETHFKLASTNYGSYGMSGFPTHDLAFHVESEFEFNTMPRGTLIPYHAERFGSTSHITPSIPMVEVTSHIPPRSRVSDPIRIPDPRRVMIGNSTYLITHILHPLSLVLRMFTLYLIHMVLWAVTLLRVMSVLRLLDW